MDCVVVPTKAVLWDLCQLGLPEILAVAQVMFFNSKRNCMSRGPLGSCLRTALFIQLYEYGRKPKKASGRSLQVREGGWSSGDP